MAKVLVAGGLGAPDEDPKLSEARRQFAASVGREIVSRGHTLLGGCRTDLDAVVAKAGASAAVEQKLEQRRFIRSWVTKTTTPSHDIGEILLQTVKPWTSAADVERESLGKTQSRGDWMKRCHPGRIFSHGETNMDVVSL